MYFGNMKRFVKYSIIRSPTESSQNMLYIPPAPPKKYIISILFVLYRNLMCLEYSKKFTKSAYMFDNKTKVNVLY